MVNDYGQIAILGEVLENAMSPKDSEHSRNRQDKPLKDAVVKSVVIERA